MDAFFASVEQRDNPDLKGKPIAVGGSRQRGVVAAASYEARKFGVRSAMPSIKAATLCPDLIFVKPRFEAYKDVSNQIKNIFKNFTPIIEPLSLDEAYLDITNLPEGYDSASEVAERIRKDIFNTTQLTASAGVSFNKFLAKMASDVNKPNGIFIIPPQNALEFLGQLEIRKFYGIGKVTAQKFQKLGILYGADLQKFPLNTLEQHFGKHAQHFYNLARGIDNREVISHRERKSIGAERTFSDDIFEITELDSILKNIAQTVADRCKKNNKKGRTITLKVKFSNFNQITRSITDNEFKNDSKIIYYSSKNLLEELKEEIQNGVRLIGITLSNFEKERSPNLQLRLPL